MTELFDELFSHWCVPYEHWTAPQYLKDEPTRAYGQYAFEAGFKLGMQLAVSSLDANALAKVD